MIYSVSPTEAIVGCLLLTALFEIITCFLRFRLRLEACCSTAAVGGFTGGLRIHHAYVGLVVMMLGMPWAAPHPLFTWSAVVGSALVLSDLVHHFLVLWPMTGSPEFDLFYPQDTSVSAAQETAAAETT